MKSESELLCMAARARAQAETARAALAAGQAADPDLAQEAIRVAHGVELGLQWALNQISDAAVLPADLFPVHRNVDYVAFICPAIMPDGHCFMAVWESAGTVRQDLVSPIAMTVGPTQLFGPPDPSGPPDRNSRLRNLADKALAEAGWERTGNWANKDFNMHADVRRKPGRS